MTRRHSLGRPEIDFGNGHSDIRDSDLAPYIVSVYSEDCFPIGYIVKIISVYSEDCFHILPSSQSNMSL